MDQEVEGELVDVESELVGVQDAAAKEMGVGSPRGIVHANEEMVTATFQPGKLGFVVEKGTGRVVLITTGSHVGVRVGWKVKLIDGMPYDFSLLMQQHFGEAPYSLTFIVSEGSNVSGKVGCVSSSCKANEQGQSDNTSAMLKPVQFGSEVSTAYASTISTSSNQNEEALWQLALPGLATSTILGELEECIGQNTCMSKRAGGFGEQSPRT